MAKLVPHSNAIFQNNALLSVGDKSFANGKLRGPKLNASKDVENIEKSHLPCMYGDDYAMEEIFSCGEAAGDDDSRILNAPNLIKGVNEKPKRFVL